MFPPHVSPNRYVQRMADVCVGDKRINGGKFLNVVGLRGWK